MTFVHKDPSRNSNVSEHFGMPCICIAVLLIGPKNNQVFVDFPCGQPGMYVGVTFPEAARKSLQEREREERARSRNCESRR